MWNYLLTINEEEKADEQDAFINIIDKFDPYQPILVFALVSKSLTYTQSVCPIFFTK